MQRLRAGHGEAGHDGPHQLHSAGQLACEGLRPACLHPASSKVLYFGICYNWDGAAEHLTVFDHLSLDQTRPNSLAAGSPQGDQHMEHQWSIWRG